MSSDRVKYISLNVRGISNFRKRRSIFHWCRSQNANLIFLQETHSTVEQESQWKKEWGVNKMFFAHGSHNSRGVAILIKKGTDIQVKQSVIDPLGRFVILEAEVGDKKLVIANIYAPNNDRESVKFFRQVNLIMKEKNLDIEENIIIGGDFNCPLNPFVDKKGGIMIPRQSVINAIEEIQTDFDLHDIWRIKNPNTLSYSWGQSKPFIFCRLDYWLISNNLRDYVTNVDIIPAIKTDHSAIYLEIQDTLESCKGPGFWKLNTSLLSNEKFIETMESNIPSWIEDSNDIIDNRLKWDFVKYKIRKESIQFSKRLAKTKREKELELNLKYQEAEKCLQNNPTRENKEVRDKFKCELESYFKTKVDGLVIRSRARWHEHGEKNSKYFLNLEKRNHVKKHMRKLFLSGVITSDPFQILNGQKRFYSSLYRSSGNEMDWNSEKQFFNNEHIPKLTEEQQFACEGKITLEEAKRSLETFAMNKVPGNDGIPVEFYQKFWPLVSQLMVKSFNEAFDNKEMSISQKQAVIILLEKDGKDRCYLDNWRPISLLNVDSKIASKVIALRIIKILPEIIHSNQLGYVKERYIGEAIRSILDVMEYTEKENIPGIMLFIDFKKAFDSLEWNYLYKCLETFNFGTDLINWVKTFYNNSSSCVINNGLSSEYFPLQKGVRQGDPLSPYLFLIAIELLSIAIRNDPEVEGISIDSEEFKIVQYADDMTAFLSNVKAADKLFKLLEDFGKYSGLKLNYSKTEAMWIGSNKENISAPLGLKWSKTIKALGVYFTYDSVESETKNFYDKLKDIHKVINLWKWRNLSLYGKVTIIKSFLLPKFTHVLSTLPVPVKFVANLKKVIFNFLWNGPDKVTRLAVINKTNFGGLKLVDINEFVKAIRLAWISRIFNKNTGFWKAFLKHALKGQGGFFFLECNYDIKEYEIKTQFYRELLQWWSEFRETFSNKPLTADQIIWNNKNIKVNKKTVFYKSFVARDVIYLTDLEFEYNNIDSFSKACDKGIQDKDLLIWMGIRSAVPTSLKNNIKKVTEKTLQFQLGNSSFNPYDSKCKHYYAKLVAKKAKKSKGFNKVQSEYNLDEEATQYIFMLPCNLNCDTYTRSFQFKILNDICFTNSKLARIGYIDNDSCSFCANCVETVIHLFVDCEIVLLFWKEFEKYWERLSNVLVTLTRQDILHGVMKDHCSDSMLLNCFILLGKIHIWKCRKNGAKPSIAIFKHLVTEDYCVEKYIAVKNNDLKAFKEKWGVFENAKENDKT